MNRALLLLGLIALSACQPSPETPSGEARAPLVYRQALSEAPLGFDPLKSGTAYSAAVVSNVYDTLYRYRWLAEPHQITPNLAAALPEVSADGLTVRIRLKPGVYFQDDPAFPNGRGRQVLAADVVYSLKRHFVPSNHSEGAWLWSDALVGVADWVAAGADMNTELPGLHAPGPDLVEFKLLKPYPQLPYTLAQGYAAIVPVEAVAHYGADLARHTVGSGPFKLVKFDGALAVLERNGQFRREPINLAAEGFDPVRHHGYGLEKLDKRIGPLVDRVELHFLSDSATSTMAIERESLDFASINSLGLQRFVAPFDAQKEKAALRPEFAQNFRLGSAQELGSVFISFNMQDPELGASQNPALDIKHRKLRCAIRAAYDWNERNDKIYQGTAFAFSGVIPPNVPGFEARLLGSQSDLTQAKSLLAEAGYRANELPVLRYGAQSSLEQRRIFELFRAQLLAIGYPADKWQWQSFPSFGAYIEAVNRSEVMLMEMGWQLDYPDAQNVLQLYYGPFSAPQVNNANYQNAVFDQRYEASLAARSEAERIALYAQMNQQLIDDCVAISGLSRMSYFLWRKELVTFPTNAQMAGVAWRFLEVLP